MEQNAKMNFKAEVQAGVNGRDWGDIQSRRFWFHAFFWNLSNIPTTPGALRACVGNLRDFPSYMKGRR